MKAPEELAEEALIKVLALYSGTTSSQRADMEEHDCQKNVIARAIRLAVEDALTEAVDCMREQSVACKKRDDLLWDGKTILDSHEAIQWDKAAALIGMLKVRKMESA